jgi:hypothetical protein
MIVLEQPEHKTALYARLGHIVPRYLRSHSHALWIISACQVHQLQHHALLVQTHKA